MTTNQPSSLVWIFCSSILLAAAPTAGGAPWLRHTIDQSFQGADGVRVADLNRDGLPDLTTGWEEAGKVRVYLHPGYGRSKRPWPAVTIAEVASPEDAFFVDLNGDGQLDVVSSCEGRTRRLFVHWAPKEQGRLLDASAWRTEALPAAGRGQMWMFGLPYPFQGGPGLIAGSKGNNATVTWFYPAKPSSIALDDWRAQPLYSAGWIMSLLLEDLNGDGCADLLVSDRKGPNSGVLWLANPGLASRPHSEWAEHRIGLDGREVMFVDFADMNRDGRKDVVAAVKPRAISFLFQPPTPARRWQEISVNLPQTIGTAKAVRVGDIDRDGRPEVVFSCEDAHAPKSGVVWISWATDRLETGLTVHDISGPEGVKFDLLQLLDLDGDGDLDVITCEERTNLGVIWYENPGHGTAIPK